jgi:hypothetical protein
MDSIIIGVVGQSFTVLTCKDVTADSQRREGGEGGGGEGGGRGGGGGTFEILITTSMPDTTLPKTGCLDSPSEKIRIATRHGVAHAKMRRRASANMDCNRESKRRRRKARKANLERTNPENHCGQR